MKPNLGDIEYMRAQFARSSLPEFIKLAWPIVEPTRKLIWNWHLDVMCEVLTDVTRGNIKRLIINIPPGCSKSLIVNVFWPAWMWTSNPGLRFLSFAYTDVNTIRDNRSVRSIVTSPWYRKYYDLRLAPDQQGKIRFDTTAKGWRIASSVEGQGTGAHPNYLIIDDPIKADEASSETKLASCNEWYDSTIPTRISLNPAMVLVMQRLHLNDLTAHLLSLGGWEHLMLPMRFDPAYADKRDRRTVAGELLNPIVFPESAVRGLEIEMGSIKSAGQLQQQPVPAGGALIKREWLPIVDAAPVKARRCRGWDIAYTEGAGDATVGIKISVAEDGIWYVEHMVKQRSGPAGVDKVIRSTAEIDGKSCLVREGSGSGKDTIAARTVALAGWDYAASPERVSKEERGGPFRAQCEAGNVRVVRGDWNAEYIDAMTSFPLSKHDDEWDATMAAFNPLVVSRPKTSATWGGAALRAVNTT